MNVQIDFLVDYDKSYNSFSLGISFFHQFNSIFYLLSGLWENNIQNSALTML